MVNSVKVAYFSMEIGMMDELLSGGLGVLAADTLKSAADMRVPMLGVSNLYKRGYFKQTIQNNYQHQDFVLFNPNDPKNKLTELDVGTTVNIQGEEVRIKAYLYEYEGQTGFKIPVVYLSTDVEGNSENGRRITDRLYMQEHGDNKYWRIAQEIVLGIGGVKIVHELNKKYPGQFPLPENYHLNEGHGAFATLELLKQYGEKEARAKTVFTTHTPVSAGHDEFHYGMIDDLMRGYLHGIDIRRLAGRDTLNTTILALNMSRAANGVSYMHGEVSRDMFRDHKIGHITNGVHSFTWTSPEMQAVFDKYIPEWRKDPTKLEHASRIPTSEIIAAHAAAKARLVNYINENNVLGGAKFNPELPVVGFARRFTDYKRADMPFWNLEGLIKASGGRLQMVFAGKAHPHDGRGQEIIHFVAKQAPALEGKVALAMLEDYDTKKAALLVQGSDFWLNLPRRPYEASGTSGMKAAHNGVPMASTIDGWWVEALQIGGKRQGGYSIGPEPTREIRWAPNDQEDMRDTHRVISEEMLPDFDNQEEFAEHKMRGAIRNAAFFNTHRMLADYIRKVYDKK